MFVQQALLANWLTGHLIKTETDKIETKKQKQAAHPRDPLPLMGLAYIKGTSEEL